MARSPRRSRSPEPHRSSHRSHNRSPSPSHRYERSRAGGSGSDSRRPDERRSGRYDDEEAYDARRSGDRYRDRGSGRDRDDRGGRDGDRYRDRERDRYRDDGRRREDRYAGESSTTSRRERDPSPPPPSSRRNRSPSPPPRPSTKPASSAASPVPEGKPKTAKERLEAWKKQRELEKLKDGKRASATPEPDKKPSISSPGPSTSKIGHLPAKPTGFSLGTLSRIGLPVKPGSAPIKRAMALDDEAEPERKLQKLDNLPEVNPEVQSGADAKVAAVDADLAVVDGDEDMEENTMPEVLTAAKAESKMDVDAKPEEEEEDELEAFMKQNDSEVKRVNTTDAKRMGLLELDDDGDNEDEVKNKAEEELNKAEALLQMAASKSRKKDLPTPDHSKIEYEPFRKSFYSAPVEVLDMDEEEAELMRLEMDGIKIRGLDAPRPVKNWGAFGLPTSTLEIIRQKEWATPTAIQAQAIPAVMSGRDVIGIAKTGSGKTIAFLMPLLRHVKDQRPVTGNEGPIALILSPTRELAMQIHKEAKVFVQGIGMRIVCCVGGQSISEDIAMMKKGAEVIVCTPGRMIDLLTANNGRVTNLRRCTYLVMDEADRMFDMGFEPQVMKIVNNTRPDAQKVLFSATFPKTMEGLARKILVRPLEITVGGRSVVAAEIDQRVEVRDNDTKFTRLLEILGEQGEEHKDDEEDSRTLVFVDRQESADDLFRELLQRGYVCASLHGGKEQVDRDEAIKNFKNGDVPIIVATSVAARGLDVKELRLVINYDAPNHMEDYVHRAGRTGRAGNTGVCITFITPEQDRFSVDIVRALEASKAFIPPDLKAMADAFLAKIRTGKAKAAGNGFKGKGLERLEKKREEKDRSEKTTYGDTSEALSLASREGAVIPYKPKTNEFKPNVTSSHQQGDGDYTFTEIHVEIVNGPAPDKANIPSLYTASGGKGSSGSHGNMAAQLPASTLAALEKAKAEGRNVDASRLASIVSKLTQHIELTKAEKFGLAVREDTSGHKKTKDPDATDWHAIFPINDYPQKARWQVTNKQKTMLLAENTGASITQRGIFYPPGEEPKLGAEPKLHFLIESNEKERVEAAVAEIRRLLVDGSMSALNANDRGGAGGPGRYAV